jgi:hypothetical protein
MLSRISVNDSSDVAHIVDKILEYERTPPANANFYTTTPLARLFEDDTDSPTDPSPSDGREDDVWVLIERAEEMRDALIADGYTADRIYNFSGGWAQGPQQWNDGTNLPDHLTQQPPTVFAWNGNTNDIVTAFNNGTFMITYRGHGGRGGWSRPSFRTGDFGQSNDISFNVPAGAGVGPVTIMAKGRVSKKYATIILDSDLAKGKVASGQVAKFALTAYIKGKMIGGANFEIKKK